MWRYILLSAISLLLFFKEADGQEYEPPRPIMTQSLLKDFIRAQLVYPTTAQSKHEEGTVEIAFKVNKKGETSGIHILKSVSSDVDSAALKLFRLILWKPGKHFGVPMDSENNFDIKYNIKKYKNWVKKRGYDSIPIPYRPISTSLKIYSLKDLDKPPAAIPEEKKASLQEFIVHQLKMPDAAVKLHLTGTVKLRFVIETNGLPSNFTVVEALGGGCTEEAIRVAQMIRWIPGLKNDRAVRSFYDLTFTFAPADKLRNKNIPNQGNTGL